MTVDKPLDPTGLLKSFDFKAKIEAPETKDEDLRYFWTSLKSIPVQTFEIELNKKDVEALELSSTPEVKIVTPRKFWFDWEMTFVGSVKEFKIVDPENGRYSYKFSSSSWSLDAPNDWLSRFLRWLLRRNRQR